MRCVCASPRGGDRLHEYSSRLHPSEQPMAARGLTATADQRAALLLSTTPEPPALARFLIVLSSPCLRVFQEISLLFSRLLAHASLSRHRHVALDCLRSSTPLVLLRRPHHGHALACPRHCLAWWHPLNGSLSHFLGLLCLARPQVPMVLMNNGGKAHHGARGIPGSLDSVKLLWASCFACAVLALRSPAYCSRKASFLATSWSSGGYVLATFLAADKNPTPARLRSAGSRSSPSSSQQR